jgi:hypothetical protein
MLRIVQNGALRETLGAAGYKEAATRLNARTQSEKLETLLLSV